MLLMAVVAAMVQEYIIMMRRILGQVVRDAPFPRNVRLIMLRRLDDYSVFAYM
ncbi:hypothetical protein Mp_5g06350 [Marchantia polymorpha subsp. ruderalis]|uniref:Uncharacterized protein n=2 Tax=Marchantia polymorpha TaxID=3197 RepID=A0AAF6BFJ3_MARPO|nr:hypothetical protein MARPO_0189s0019 [Marchantia polymorpha]BBN10777.1 hypothetical protein Mp_5g06350 [Marchantia polymorpha subsp. ruderalis]|eukprot:PTQ27647.1 hypothetical protein MARPO_0189s0019 [Marchantia polymorpha]